MPEVPYPQYRCPVCGKELPLTEARVTVTCSPNFGYRHCLRALGDKRLEDHDLGSIRLVFNGAEPISVELAEEFLDRLQMLGNPFGVIQARD